MIPFEEMDVRLERLGKNRAWLVEAAKRSPDAVRAALAPNASPKNRSEKLQTVLSDAIEREEEAQSSAKLHPLYQRQQLVLRPTEEEYQRWSEAQRRGGQPTLSAWAVDSLNQITEGMCTSEYPSSWNVTEWSAARSALEASEVAAKAKAAKKNKTPKRA